MRGLANQNKTFSMIGYFAALGSAALVGLFTVLNKWLLGEQVPVMTAVAWTYGVAGLALLPWALRARGFTVNPLNSDALKKNGRHLFARVFVSWYDVQA